MANTTQTAQPARSTQVGMAPVRTVAMARLSQGVYIDHHVVSEPDCAKTLHRLDGPAEVSVYPPSNVNPLHVVWRVDGVLRRLDGPADTQSGGYMTWFIPEDVDARVLVGVTAPRKANL